MAVIYSFWTYLKLKLFDISIGTDTCLKHWIAINGSV